MLARPIIYGVVAFSISFLVCALFVPAELIEHIQGSDYEGWQLVPGAIRSMYVCPLVCAAGAAWIGWNRRVKQNPSRDGDETKPGSSIVDARS